MLVVKKLVDSKTNINLFIYYFRWKLQFSNRYFSFGKRVWILHIRLLHSKHSFGRRFLGVILA